MALRFTAAAEDYVIGTFGDGNRNGVRTAEADTGIDPHVAPAVTLSSYFPGVRVGLDAAIGLGADPIRLGGATLLSFSPIGTATSGSIYVLGRDGTQLVVRVLGATARTRVLRFDRATSTWIQP